MKLKKRLAIAFGLALPMAAFAAEQPVVDTDVVFRAPYTEDFEIDGSLANPIWQVAETLPPICHDKNQNGGRPLPYRADIRVAYSKAALYYGGTVYQNMNTCIAKWDQHDLSIWDDDNLELFLFVPGDDGNILYQLVINPLGSVADLKDGNINWNAEGIAIKTKRYDDRWTIEVRLPFASLPMERPAPGDYIGARFCRWIHDGKDRYHGAQPQLINAGNDQRARFAKLLFLPPTGEGAAEIIAEANAYKADAFRRKFYGRYDKIVARFDEVAGGTAAFRHSRHPVHRNALAGVEKMATALADFRKRHGEALAKRRDIPNEDATGLLNEWAEFERFANDNAYVMWETSPWEIGSPKDMPPDGASMMPDKIMFELAGNEREQVCLDVHGLLTGARLDLRFWPETLEPKNGPFLSSDSFEVYLEPFVNIEGETVTMPLVRAPGNVVTVSPGRTVRVWIVFNSRGVRAGDYATTLKVKAMTGSDVKTRNVPLAAKVWNFTLPETRDWPMKSFFWGAFSFDHDEVALLELMHESHVTHGWTQHHRYQYGLHGEREYWKAPRQGTGRKDPDHDFDDDVALHGNEAFLRRAKELGMRFVIGWGTPRSLDWFKVMTKRLRDMGFDYEDFVFKGLIADEFVRAQIPEWAKRRDEVWAWNTNLWFQAVLLSTPPPTGPSVSDIAEAHLPEFYRNWTVIRNLTKERQGRGADIMKLLSEKGCHVWSYECSHFMHKQPILNYYRLYPWEARLLNLEGIAIWTIYSPKGDGWDSRDGFDDGICWRGLDRKPIPTKQLAAVREGLEDVAYMDRLERELAKAKAAGRNYPAYGRLLADRAAIMEANDQSKVDAWRLAAGRAIHELSCVPYDIRPRTDGTVIDSIVEAKAALDEIMKTNGFVRVTIHPVDTGRKEFDAAVNAEVVKFADGKRVVAKGFPEKRLRTYARTDATGTRGKWWWLYRLRENRDRIAREGGQYDVVMLGDSITHFWHDFDYWTGGLKVWKKAQRELKLLNLGYGGDNTKNLRWRLRNGELDGYKAKVFQIMIGTNNRTAPEKTAADIREIIDLVKARHPESKILLLSIFPREDRLERHQANQKVNAIIRDYADGETVFHMDIGQVFLGEDGKMKAGLSPDNDKLHLKGWGYQLWWDAVSPKLKELCK